MGRRLSKKALGAWLDLLEGTPEGTIKLVNMFRCLEHSLTTASKLRGFLGDCVTLGATTSADALAHCCEICDRNDRYFALKKVNLSGGPADTALGTSMGASTFHRFLLERPTSIVKRVVPVEPKNPHDPLEEVAYGRALASATSRANWFKASSTLGKPHPNTKRMWFAEVDRLEAQVKSDGATETDATKARDALGLVDMCGDTYLLSVRFPTQAIQACKGIKVARPAFGDQGNRRFAVYLGKGAEGDYRRGWGVTVHLGRLLASKRTIAGVPERVCSPVAVSQIAGSIRVVPLGWVDGQRGTPGGVDSDDEFIKRLRGRTRLSTMKDKLLGLSTVP